MGDENPPTPSTSSAARKKEEKARKKDQRSWENVVKSMGDMPETDRIDVIQQRYNSIYNDLRQTASCYQHLEKKFITLQKERDQARSELNKNILAKAKLESLCRELQKQNKAIKGEEYDENEELISSGTEDEACQAEGDQELIQLLDPCTTDSTLDPELCLPSHLMMDFSDSELDGAGDGSTPQLESHFTLPTLDSDTESEENLDDTVIDLEDPSSSSEILIKEARSVPITKKDHEALADDNELEEPQPSSGDLHEDLSLETLPLYKPAAVTDVPTQGGHATLVKGSEARTDIRELERGGSVPSEESSSSTIQLRESEGKTEFKKE